MQLFCSWLHGPDVDKSPRTARSHTLQVWNVLRAISRTLEVDAFLDVEAVKTRWLTPFLKQHQPGTVKSYIGSVVLFLEFLLARRLIDKRTEATGAIAELRRVGKVMRKRSLLRRVEIETEDLGRFCNIFNF